MTNVSLNNLTPGELRKLGIFPGTHTDSCMSEYDHNPDDGNEFKGEYSIGRDC